MQLTKRILFQVILPLMVVLYFGSLWISCRTFPGYTIWSYFISNMGHPERNPEGWIIWSIGHLINGCFIIVLGLYLLRISQRIQHQNNEKFRSSKIGSICICISGLGFILMCLIPQYPGLDGYHAMNAVLLIGGLYLGFIFWGITIFHLNFIPKPIKILYTTISSFAPIGVIVSFILSYLIFGSLSACSYGTCIWILNIQFWEWMILIIGEIALFTLLAILPEDPENFSKNTQQ